MEFNIGPEHVARRHRNPDIEVDLHVTGVTMPGGNSNWEITVNKDFNPFELAHILELAAKVLRGAGEDVIRPDGALETNIQSIERIDNKPLDLHPIRAYYVDLINQTGCTMSKKLLEGIKDTFSLLLDEIKAANLNEAEALEVCDLAAKLRVAAKDKLPKAPTVEDEPNPEDE